MQSIILSFSCLLRPWQVFDRHRSRNEMVNLSFKTLRNSYNFICFFKLNADHYFCFQIVKAEKEFKFYY